ncbi:right-handed parallel beta-helix repeat-containing protein [Priestia megaterium]|uniref:right-handed parallel beta-helix repeat-containing protein n=1 Tax=Priestia megaterium TaxID=1404 RepID=UPI00234F3526|nr:right-handed parallel beta-helix repeat-containing protein [Priestia megaterium]MDC7783897.1 glycosyl hydrolase family 28-related protein [Priestia megaterium]
MVRRNFLKDLLFWILAFFLGYTGNILNRRSTFEFGNNGSERVNNLIDPSNDPNNNLDSILKKIQDVIHVKEFGAKGDGKTDDTIAINKAIKFCFKHKKALNFGSGSYLYDRKMTWNIDGQFNGYFIEWVGNGAQILFKRLDIAYIAFYKMEFVHIEGIDFVGPAKTGGLPNQNATGIAIYSTKRLIINRCSFTNFIGDGLLISSEQMNNRERSSQNIKIQNCYFNNNGRGGLTIVGCVSGMVENNHFGPERLTLAPVVGEVLHIESDHQTRLGIEGLNICYNLIYNSVNLTNSSWTEGYVGEKDTWINFHHNKIIVHDNLYGITSAGGNIKITENEISVTRSMASDDLGIGALHLKCNSVIIERNTIKTFGKKTLISIYNWTYETRGKVILRENNYITTNCSYIYRFYNDKFGKFTKTHSITRICREDYSKIKNANWLISAPQGGGNALKYYLEGIEWKHLNGMEFKNTTKKHLLYLRDCTITAGASLLNWNKSGAAIRVYHENCILSGTIDSNVPTYPINLTAVYKIVEKIGIPDDSYEMGIVGRENKLTRTSTGKYEWNTFTFNELYNYTFIAQTLLTSKEKESYYISIRYPSNEEGLLVIEIRNGLNKLVDLPDNSRIQIIGRMLNKKAISVVVS